MDKLTDDLKKTYYKDTHEYDDEYDDEDFLKNKISFRSRQILKLVLM
jgi:hypothetical protein